MKEDSYNIQEFLQDYAESLPNKEIRIINAAINIFSEKGLIPREPRRSPSGRELRRERYFDIFQPRIPF